MAYLRKEFVDVLVVVQQVGYPGIITGAPVGELPKGSCYRIHRAAEGVPAGIDVITEAMGGGEVKSARLNRARLVTPWSASVSGRRLSRQDTPPRDTGTRDTGCTEGKK